MKITKNIVVTIHYTLTDDNSEVIDSSQGGEPLTYLHGHGGIIPGLEAELEGKMLDDAFKVSIQPDLAYGVIDKNLIFRINRSSFADSKNIKTGMQVRGQLTKEGPSMIFWVKEVNNEDIVLDGNHPLAGQTLHFDVKVIELRNATKKK